MARGGFDSRQLKAFAKKLEKSLAQGDAQVLAHKCANEIAGRVYREAKLRTPVRDIGGGTLRDGWETSAPAVSGDTVEITVSNSVEYAPYVEYGHRIVVGGKISEGGKVIGFRPGQFMLRRAEERVRDIAPKILEEKLTKFLNGLMKNE